MGATMVVFPLLLAGALRLGERCCFMTAIEAERI